METEEFNSLEKALEALQVAAEAIGAMPSIVEATADNDNDSGEIIFTVQGGQSFVLSLREQED